MRRKREEEKLPEEGSRRKQAEEKLSGERSRIGAAARNEDDLKKARDIIGKKDDRRTARNKDALEKAREIIVKKDDGRKTRNKAGERILKEGPGKMASERRKWNLSERFCQWLSARVQGRWPGREGVEESLRLLGREIDAEARTEHYYAEKLKLIFVIAFAGLAISGLVFLSGKQSRRLVDGYYLPRSDQSYTQELELQSEDGREETVEVEIAPRELTQEESRKLLEEELTQLESYILGENLSLEEVRSDLDLLREIEGTSVTLAWELDSYEVLNLDGSIREENVTEEGTLVELRACLTCGGETAVYQAVARVLPPILNEDEIWEASVQEALENYQTASSQDTMQELPASIQGYTVSWKENGAAAAGVFLLLTLLLLPLIYTAKDRDLKKQVQERERQLTRDYAGLVSKLVLLMGAGAAPRNAWELMVRDYQIKKDVGREKPRYAYEEMTQALHEMSSGVAETRAYENFGMRCRLPSYLKLSALLEQNLKKGSRGLTALLQAEVAEAFAQRLAYARNQGEEASTRLLLPMILMLVVVMLIILVPAALSMQV